MRPGAVVLHGLTGSTRSVEPVAQALVSAGFAVDVPTLAGHGAGNDDLAATGWDDWVGSAEAAYSRIRRDRDPVAVVGLSMGGALACHLAAAHPDLAAVVAVNAFIDPPAESFVDLLGEMLAQGVDMIDGIGGDVARRDAIDEGGNDRLPVACLLSLSRGLAELAPRLAAITCPVLVATSTVDHVVPPVSSDVLASAVSGPVSRLTLENSYHLATIDHDGPLVAERTVSFLSDAMGVAAGRG